MQQFQISSFHIFESKVLVLQAEDKKFLKRAFVSFLSEPVIREWQEHLLRPFLGNVHSLCVPAQSRPVDAVLTRIVSREHQLELSFDLDTGEEVSRLVDRHKLDDLHSEGIFLHTEIHRDAADTLGLELSRYLPLDYAVRQMAAPALVDFYDQNLLGKPIQTTSNFKLHSPLVDVSYKDVRIGNEMSRIYYPRVLNSVTPTVVWAQGGRSYKLCGRALLIFTLQEDGATGKLAAMPSSANFGLIKQVASSYQLSIE